ncbi:MAG: protein-glutamate O-methyltransferase CheR, partial [Myxococcota bacterium]
MKPQTLAKKLPDRTEAALPLTDEQFAWIRRQIKLRTGIHLHKNKQHLVHNRLSSRLRQLALHSFQDYIELLAGRGSSELEYFVNALTTNVTSFFREPHHFEFLAHHVMPALRRQGRVSRLWSAGCSTGMEPYSIAMILHEYIARHGLLSAELLATDLNTDALKTAVRGVYGLETAQGVSLQRRRQFALKGVGGNAGKLRMKASLTQAV